MLWFGKKRDKSFEEKIREYMSKDSDESVYSQDVEKITEMKKVLLEKAQQRREAVHVFTDDRMPEWYKDIGSELKQVSGTCSMFFYSLEPDFCDIPSELQNLGVHFSIVPVTRAKIGYPRPFLIVGNSICCLLDTGRFGFQKGSVTLNFNKPMFRELVLSGLKTEIVLQEAFSKDFRGKDGEELSIFEGHIVPCCRKRYLA